MGECFVIRELISRLGYSMIQPAEIFPSLMDSMGKVYHETFKEFTQRKEIFFVKR